MPQTHGSTHLICYVTYSEKGACDLWVTVANSPCMLCYVQWEGGTPHSYGPTHLVCYVMYSEKGARHRFVAKLTWYTMLCTVRRGHATDSWVNSPGMLCYVQWEGGMPHSYGPTHLVCYVMYSEKGAHQRFVGKLTWYTMLCTVRRGHFTDSWVTVANSPGMLCYVQWEGARHRLVGQLTWYAMLCTVRRGHATDLWVNSPGMLCYVQWEGGMPQTRGSLWCVGRLLYILHM